MHLTQPATSVLGIRSSLTRAEQVSGVVRPLLSPTPQTKGYSLVSAPAQSGSGEAREVVYAAWHIWNIAADAAKRATDVKAVHPRACTSDSVSAVIVAATATEAFINELSHMLSTLDGLDRRSLPTTPIDWKGIGELLEQFEDAHAQVTAKYLLASILLPKDALRKGQQPYQDFSMLIDIRNDFAHPKAQIRPPKYFDTFVNKGGHTTSRLTR